MVKFGRHLSLFNLVILVITIIIAAVIINADDATTLELILSALFSLTLLIISLTFVFALIGLFKSTLKWSALMIIFVNILVITFYVISIILCSSDL